MDSQPQAVEVPVVVKSVNRLADKSYSIRCITTREYAVEETIPLQLLMDEPCDMLLRPEGMAPEPPDPEGDTYTRKTRPALDLPALIEAAEAMMVEDGRDDDDYSRLAEEIAKAKLVRRPAPKNEASLSQKIRWRAEEVGRLRGIENYYEDVATRVIAKLDQEAKIYG